VVKRLVSADNVTGQLPDVVVSWLNANLDIPEPTPVGDQFVPNAGPGLREFIARSATSAAAPSDVLVACCSHGEGTGAGSFGNRYVDLLFARMRREFQPRTIVGGRGYLPAKYSEFTIPGPATVYGGADSGNNGFGLGGRSLYIASDNAGIRYDAAAPLGQLNGTSFDVVYLPLGNGGSITVTIDGVAQTAFSTVGAQAEFAIKRFTFATPGKHDVTVAHTNGTANIVLNGVIEYNGDETAGLRFWDASHFGWSTDTYLNNLVYPGAWQAQIGKIKPALIGTDLHVNDYLNNIPVASMVANYQKLIGDANNGATFPPSVVIVHAFEPKHSGTPLASWDAYLAGLGQLRSLFPNQVTVVDLSKVMPKPDADTTGLYLTDKIHHTAKGHGLQAALVAQRIGV
jgi:hypothetical protein